MKVDNIENYTLGTLNQLKDAYDQFLEESEGYDPDFPMSGLGGKKGKDGMKTIKVSGTNVYSLYDEDNPDPNFEGIPRSAISKAMNKGKK